MKTFGAYVAALVIGVATAVFVLWLGRTTPVGSHLTFAVAVISGLAIVAAFLSALLPRHWLGIALALSLPSSVLGIVTFVLVARLGEYYWTWLWAALGALVASLLGAWFTARGR